MADAKSRASVAPARFLTPHGLLKHLAEFERRLLIAWDATGAFMIDLSVDGNISLSINDEPA
jgi:hypothetical protein